MQYIYIIGKIISHILPYCHLIQEILVLPFSVAPNCFIRKIFSIFLYCCGLRVDSLESTGTENITLLKVEVYR